MKRLITLAAALVLGGSLSPRAVAQSATPPAEPGTRQQEKEQKEKEDKREETKKKKSSKKKSEKKDAEKKDEKKAHVPPAEPKQSTTKPNPPDKPGEQEGR